MNDPLVIPNGVRIPARIGDEAVPPEVLFAGRLAPEKGIDELVEAALRLAATANPSRRTTIVSASFG